MKNDDLDFAEIQKMFAARDAQRKKQAEEEAKRRRSQLTVIDNRSKLRNEPAYNNMHAKNIKVTDKGYSLSKTEELALRIGAFVVAVAIGITAYFGLGRKEEKFEVNNTNNIQCEQPYEPSGNNWDNVFEEYKPVVKEINPAECNMSDFTILLRQSTKNVNKVVAVAEKELTELGINNQIVHSDEDITKIIETLKKESNRDIIVINVDGLANTASSGTVIMTNYSNAAKSCDVLAMAINNSNEDIYGISSEIRCGKKTPNGERAETSVEKAIRDAGHTNVACLTIAPSSSCIDSEIEINNLSTAIVEGVVRFASLNKNERYVDLIRRIEYGDTISGLAASYNVSEADIRANNKEALDSNNGLLRHNAAFLVKDAHINLTSAVTVNNPTITTNPHDVETKMSYYEVKSGDTVSEIAEKLGIKASELVIPSGDINKIYPGDKIGYETEAGKILVSKSYKNTK